MRFGLLVTLMSCQPEWMDIMTLEEGELSNEDEVDTEDSLETEANEDPEQAEDSEPLEPAEDPLLTLEEVYGDHQGTLLIEIDNQTQWPDGCSENITITVNEDGMWTGVTPCTTTWTGTWMVTLSGQLTDISNVYTPVFGAVAYDEAYDLPHHETESTGYSEMPDNRTFVMSLEWESQVGYFAVSGSAELTLQ